MELNVEIEPQLNHNNPVYSNSNWKSTSIFFLIYFDHIHMSLYMSNFVKPGKSNMYANALMSKNV